MTRTPEEQIMAAAQLAALACAGAEDGALLRDLVAAHAPDARAAYDWAVRCSLYALTDRDRAEWASVAAAIGDAAAAAGVDVRPQWATVERTPARAPRPTAFTRDALWGDWR